MEDKLQTSCTGFVKDLRLQNKLFYVFFIVINKPYLQIISHAAFATRF